MKFELKFAISADLHVTLLHIWYRWRLTKCCFRTVEKRKLLYIFPRSWHRASVTGYKNREENDRYVPINAILLKMSIKEESGNRKGGSYLGYPTMVASLEGKQ